VLVDMSVVTQRCACVYTRTTGRNMPCVFNNPTIYIIECISWTIKCSILLVHGGTMKNMTIYVCYACCMSRAWFSLLWSPYYCVV